MKFLQTLREWFNAKSIERAFKNAKLPKPSVYPVTDSDKTSVAQPAQVDPVAAQVIKSAKPSGK